MLDNNKGRPPRSTITPIFRWAGSKRKVLSTLASFWSNDYKRYIEPFAGSAALFFRLQPRKAVLGDINHGLIEAYEVVREQPDEIHLNLTKIRRGERHYYTMRARDPSALNRFDRAVRFAYLNRYCFNGIFRTNTRGEFNVPYAGIKPGVIPPIEHFRKCAGMLARATLRCGDFGAILSGAGDGDFVYLDPPYAVRSRRIFRQYDQRAFTERDLGRLAEHLTSLDSRGAVFVLSYADCTEARRLFCKWIVRRIRVRRHVAGFASARRSAFELLVTNRDTEDGAC